MSRKTHPTSHRLGITTWWPSRTPNHGRSPRSKVEAIKGQFPRYSAIAYMIKGILNKYGFQISLPYITETIGGRGRIVILVKCVGVQGSSSIDQWLYQNHMRGKGSAGARENKGNYFQQGIATSSAYQRSISSVDKATVLLYTYISRYIEALLSEYEKCKYQVEIREVGAGMNQVSTGTAGILIQNLVQSDKSILPAMLDMQRALIKTQ